MKKETICLSAEICFVNVGRRGDTYGESEQRIAARAAGCPKENAAAKAMSE